MSRQADPSLAEPPREDVSLQGTGDSLHEGLGVAAGEAVQVRHRETETSAAPTGQSGRPLEQELPLEGRGEQPAHPPQPTHGPQHLGQELGVGEQGGSVEDWNGVEGDESEVDGQRGDGTEATGARAWQRHPPPEVTTALVLSRMGKLDLMSENDLAGVQVLKRDLGVGWAAEDLDRLGVLFLSELRSEREAQSAFLSGDPHPESAQSRGGQGPRVASDADGEQAEGTAQADTPRGLPGDDGPAGQGVCLAVLLPRKVSEMPASRGQQRLGSAVETSQPRVPQVNRPGGVQVAHHGRGVGLDDDRSLSETLLGQEQPSEGDQTLDQRLVLGLEGSHPRAQVEAACPEPSRGRTIPLTIPLTRTGSGLQHSAGARLALADPPVDSEHEVREEPLPPRQRQQQDQPPHVRGQEPSSINKDKLL